MGRPSKLNEETARKMAEEIAAGLPIEYACDIVGINRTTYRNWMERGEADDDAGEETEFSAFFTLIKKSYAMFVKDCKAKIREGAPGWQGTAWWLERTNSRFVPKQQIQADDEGKVTVVIGGPAPKKQRRLGDADADDKR